MELTGLHHVSAITGSAQSNLKFYTDTIGLHLVKRTVNQDDVRSYHFFYGDQTGSPGTEVTFFDWPGAASNRPGAGAISNIALSVSGEDSVQWWARRLKDQNLIVSDEFSLLGHAAIEFQDPEGQHLQIVGDPASGVPWSKSPVPSQFGTSGMHHVTLTVRSRQSISRILVEVLGMRQTLEYSLGGQPVFVFETGIGGAGKQVHVIETKENHLVRLGAGGVHHVAFRVPNTTEHQLWYERLQSFGLNASPVIDRYYFKSIYFREPGGILFELATDGPGFAADEDPEHLGEKLALPPFLEPRRAEIEAGLVPV